MKLTDIWFTALAESEDGQMIVVSGRDNISDFIKEFKFIDFIFELSKKIEKRQP